MAQPDGPNREGSDRHLEIGAARSRRWLSWVSYLVAMSIVAAVAVWFFTYFAPLRLAIAVVVFMLLCMTLMGWWAARIHEKRSGLG